MQQSGTKDFSGGLLRYNIWGLEFFFLFFCYSYAVMHCFQTIKIAMWDNLMAYLIGKGMKYGMP